MTPLLLVFSVLQKVSIACQYCRFASLRTNATKDLKRIIGKIADGKDKTPEHTTIFHEVLDGDLPEQEKELQRLGDEAQTIIGAGLETTAGARGTHSRSILPCQSASHI